jgi:hypothetical protein
MIAILARDERMVEALAFRGADMEEEALVDAMRAAPKTAMAAIRGLERRANMDSTVESLASPTHSATHTATPNSQTAPGGGSGADVTPLALDFDVTLDDRMSVDLQSDIAADARLGSTPIKTPRKDAASEAGDPRTPRALLSLESTPERGGSAEHAEQGRRHESSSVLSTPSTVTAASPGIDASFATAASEVKTSPRTPLAADVTVRLEDVMGAASQVRVSTDGAAAADLQEFVAAPTVEDASATSEAVTALADISIFVAEPDAPGTKDVANDDQPAAAMRTQPPPRLSLDTGEAADVPAAISSPAAVSDGEHEDEVGELMPAPRSSGRKKKSAAVAAVAVAAAAAAATPSSEAHSEAPQAEVAAPSAEAKEAAPEPADAAHPAALLGVHAGAEGFALNAQVQLAWESVVQEEAEGSAPAEAWQRLLCAVEAFASTAGSVAEAFVRELGTSGEALCCRSYRALCAVLDPSVRSLPIEQDGSHAPRLVHRGIVFEVAQDRALSDGQLLYQSDDRAMAVAAHARRHADAMADYFLSLASLRKSRCAPAAGAHVLTWCGVEHPDDDARRGQAGAGAAGTADCDGGHVRLPRSGTRGQP